MSGPHDVTSHEGKRCGEPCISGRRRVLASFEHAYAVAVQLCERTGADQLVIHTGNTVQPFRVSRQEPHHPKEVLALVS